MRKGHLRRAGQSQDRANLRPRAGKGKEHSPRRVLSPDAHHQRPRKHHRHLRSLLRRLHKTLRRGQELQLGDQGGRAASRAKIFWLEQSHRRDLDSGERGEGKTMRIASGFAKVLLAAGLILLSNFAASAQTLKLPPHEKIVLKNGLTLLVMEKHGVPIVSFFAIVKAGSAADPAGQDGLAGITAGLLRKGTQKRTAQQFASDLDFIGGSFDSGADSDYTTITAEFLTKDLDRGLDLFSDALLHASFPQAEV